MSIWSMCSAQPEFVLGHDLCRLGVCVLHSQSSYRDSICVGLEYAFCTARARTGIRAASVWSMCSAQPELVLGFELRRFGVCVLHSQSSYWDSVYVDLEYVFWIARARIAI